MVVELQDGTFCVVEPDDVDGGWVVGGPYATARAAAWAELGVHVHVDDEMEVDVVESERIVMRYPEGVRVVDVVRLDGRALVFQCPGEVEECAAEPHSIRHAAAWVAGVYKARR